MSGEMRRVFKDSNDGAHHKVANFAVVLSNRLTEVSILNACDAPYPMLRTRGKWSLMVKRILMRNANGRQPRKFDLEPVIVI